MGRIGKTEERFEMLHKWKQIKGQNCLLNGFCLSNSGCKKDIKIGWKWAHEGHSETDKVNYLFTQCLIYKLLFISDYSSHPSNRLSIHSIRKTINQSIRESFIHRHLWTGCYKIFCFLRAKILHLSLPTGYTYDYRKLNVLCYMIYQVTKN